MTDHGFSARAVASRPMVSRSRAPAIALTATLALAAASWAVAAWDMRGMDMGTATALGPFPSFAWLWIVMMAAMMLPGAAPAVVTRARSRDAIRAVPVFLASYLLVWALAGAVAFALYRPHGAIAAGAITIAAGLYELTPLKRHCRQRCQRSAASGFSYGLCCAGSTIGLMAILLALGVMSLLWMAVLTALVLAQKLAAPRAIVDVPLALAIVGLGAWLILAPTL